MSDDGEHEGWVANVLVDGRVSASSTGSGVIVHELSDNDREAGHEVLRYAGSDHIDVVVPWDQVTSWRVTCECGWTGSERPAVTDVKNGTRDCPEALEDSVFLPDWQAHVQPFEVLSELERLVDDLHEIETQVDDKVRRARLGGASWSQVGRAAGLTKQGAQQRWGHLVP
jgi:hypothetical protein